MLRHETEQQETEDGLTKAVTDLSSKLANKDKEVKGLNEHIVYLEDQGVKLKVSIHMHYGWH